MRADPTYATPRTLDRYTDGPAVGVAIERWLGRRPTPWQQGLLDGALERIDGPGSPYAFDSVIAIVGRRCGKTVTAFGVPLIRSLAGPVRLPNGRTVPFRAVHVAQNLTAAKQRFQEDLVEPFARRFTEAQFERAADYKRGAASTALTIDPRRGNAKDVEGARAAGISSEIRVLAPTGPSARGAGVLHRNYDEALTFTRERGMELEAAGRPTMAEMGGLAQTWTVSNIAFDTDERKHLFHLRNRGRAAATERRTDGIYYVEFSIPPDADADDERNWFRHYPALGDGIVGIRELRREREDLGPLPFNAEYLCRWPDENATGATGWHALDAESWIQAEQTNPAPENALAALAVDIDPFGRSASLSVATLDDDDGVTVEVIEHRADADWIPAALEAVAGEAVAIGIDDYGPGHDLIATLSANRPAIAHLIVPTRGPDFVAACYRFDAGIREGRTRWRRSGFHADLTAAAAAAERTSGRAWQWERRVSVVQTPLVAASLAAWALAHRPTVPASQIY